MISRFVKAAAVIAVALLATACVTNQVMSAKATAYNVAVADSSNQLLLLNALRASRRLPTYYSHLAGDTSNLTVTPTYTGNGPIGKDVAKKGLSYLYTLTATSQDQVTLASLDDQKFMRGVLTPVPVDVLGLFINQGWPPELLFSMTISKITTTRAEVADLVAAFEASCRERPDGDYCDRTIPDVLRTAQASSTASGTSPYLSRQVAACLAAGAFSAGPSATPRIGGGTNDDAQDPISFENYPPDKDKMACFQWVLRVIIALDPQQKSITSMEVVAQNVPNGANPGSAVASLLNSNYLIGPGSTRDSFTVCRKTARIGLSLEKFKVNAAASPAEADDEQTAGAEAKVSAYAATARSEAVKCGQPAPPAQAVENMAVATDKAAPSLNGALRLKLTTRSLDGMVYFLGESIRAQSLGGAGDEGIKLWVWNTREKAYEQWDLFDVRSGFGPVTVSFMNSIYSIPPACPAAANCPNPADRHTSFQAIALLNQVWGLQKEEAQLPISPLVTVINP